MLTSFIAALNPMLVLFICIAAGYTLRKAGILPHDSSKVIATLELWIFAPALSFGTMSKYCTLESLKTHGVNMLFSCFAIALSMFISILVSKLFVREHVYDRGVYQYGLAFGNAGYMGEPVVLAVFGPAALVYFKFFTLPTNLLVYTWGISVLVPRGEERKSALRSIFNFPTIATLAGVICGITGLTRFFPDFFVSSVDTLGACMGPLAMIMTGATVANFSFVSMLKKKKVYLATVLKLILIPIAIVAAVWGLKSLINLVFGTRIDNLVALLALFWSAMPLGLNTVVFPEAYGKNPETGASMALISHTFGVLTIPIVFALSEFVFGPLII